MVLYSESSLSIDYVYSDIAFISSNVLVSLSLIQHSNNRVSHGPSLNKSNAPAPKCSMANLPRTLKIPLWGVWPALLPYAL